jgi:exodeoxyribonuclease VII small subunit
MTEAKQATPPDFEDALERLEDIVKTLEAGDLGLDKSLELFEEGIRLSRFCHGKLEQAERRVEILLKAQSGDPSSEQLQAVTFEPDDTDR